MVAGIIDISGDLLRDNVVDVVDDAQGMVDSMQILSYGVQQIDTLDRMTEQIFHQLEWVLISDTVKPV